MSNRISDHEAPDWVLERMVPTPAGCWEWTGTRLKRYGGHGGDRAVVSQGEHKGSTASRAIWQELRGTLPASLVVRHSCDNGMCVRPSHLLTGTHKQNSQDALKRGRLRPGGHPLAA